MYYRLYDTDTKDYLSTGFNLESKEELYDSFIEYLGDVDSNINESDKHDLIIANGFIIDESETPFPTAYCTNCQWEGIDDDLVSKMEDGIGHTLNEITGCCPNCLTNEFINSL